jgi:hypothetical protein
MIRARAASTGHTHVITSRRYWNRKHRLLNYLDRSRRQMACSHEILFKYETYNLRVQL